MLNLHYAFNKFINYYYYIPGIPLEELGTLVKETGKNKIPALM